MGYVLVDMVPNVVVAYVVVDVDIPTDLVVDHVDLVPLDAPPVARTVGSDSSAAAAGCGAGCGRYGTWSAPAARANVSGRGCDEVRGALA